jgi:hypothetical protein
MQIKDILVNMRQLCLGCVLGGVPIRSGGLFEIHTKVQIRRYDWAIGVHLCVGTD